MQQQQEEPQKKTLNVMVPTSPINSLGNRQRQIDRKKKGIVRIGNSLSPNRRHLASSGSAGEIVGPGAHSYPANHGRSSIKSTGIGECAPIVAMLMNRRLWQQCSRIGQQGRGACREFNNSAIFFSGHNRWSTIRHDKAKNDKAKSKERQVIVKDISSATQSKFPDCYSIIL